jgi:hypothetical protein
MLPRYRLALLLAIALLPFQFNIASASNEDQNCSRAYQRLQHGPDLAKQPNKTLHNFATINNQEDDQFSNNLNDDSVWLDTCARMFFVDEIPVWTPALSSASLPKAALPANTTAFQLHSKAGSPRTLYLDFTAETIANTAWNANYNGGAAWNTPGFSMDTDYSTFSSVDQDAIYAIWQRVAEDYASFDVDVTTEVPGVGQLERSDSTDNVYGTRVLISDDMLIQKNCACGGLSYVGVADLSGTSHEYYQPSWVFSQALNHNIKYIAEAVSHEAGHSFGLSHDGTTTSAYYSGSNGWAPIMGSGYYEPLTQWSKGEYLNANNTEDDFLVMKSHGLLPRLDEDLNTPTSANSTWVGKTSSGVIADAADVDYLKITPSATGTFTFTANSGTNTQNLDIKLTLLSSDGVTVIATADPAFSKVNSENANGLSAALTFNLTNGTNYYLQIDGAGYLTPTTGGYSDYASVGSYQITTTGPVGPLSIVPVASIAATIGNLISQKLTVTGGYPNYSWSATNLPPGMVVDSSGTLTGSPTTSGNYSSVITVQDSLGNLASTTVNFNIYNKLTSATTSAAFGVVNRIYSQNITANGGSGIYTFSGINLPIGLTISSAGLISGTPTYAGNYTPAITIVDSIGNTYTFNLPISINPALSISTTALPSANLNSAYSQQLAFSGGITPYSLTISGLPSGLSMSGSGLISGAPTVAGVFTVSFTVTDAQLVSITQSYGLTVNQSLTTVTKTLPTGEMNANYSAQMQGAGGTAPYTWTATGLPTGLKLGTTGAISGIPTKAGNFSVTFVITDATAKTFSSVITMSITNALVVSTSSLAAGITNTSYSATLSGAGGVSPYSWSAIGLPSGLTISTTGLISGTPTVVSTSTVTVTLLDSLGYKVSKSFTLQIVDPLVITTTSLPNATKGVSYSYSLAASGGLTSKSWAKSAGTLPSGISLSSTGVLSGKATTSGSYSFTVKVTSGTQSTTKTFTLTVI